MKTKTAYIFISLLSASIELLAPPKTFRGNRAKISDASALFAQGQQDGVIAPVQLSSCLEETRATFSPQDATIEFSPTQLEDPCENAQAAVAFDENQETNKLPDDSHQSSAVFAAITELSGEPPVTLRTVRELQDQNHLSTLQGEGWITDCDHASTEQVTSKQSVVDPSWLEIFKAQPKDLWNKHVAENYRVERLLRELGAVPTYSILQHKAKNGSLADFISRLNQYKDGEGDTWVNEAARQAITDDQEESLKSFLTPEIRPASALTGATRALVLEYLRACGRTKKIAYDQYALGLQKVVRSLDVSQEQQVKKNKTADDDDDQ